LDVTTVSLEILLGELSKVVHITIAISTHLVPEKEDHVIFQQINNVQSLMEQDGDLHQKQ
jgi:hypothetical protein